MERTNKRMEVPQMAVKSSNPAAVSNLPQHSTMVQNVKAVYARATVSDVNAGWAWYAEAQSFAQTLATASSYGLRQVAGVIAALSPQQAWSINKANAEAAVYVHNLAGDVNGISLHTKAQMGKVARIL